MSYRICFLVLTILYFSNALAQSESFSLLFPDVSEVVNSIQTPEGDSIVVAHIRENHDTNGPYKIVVLRIDPHGKLQWNHSIERSISPAVSLLFATKDGGFIVGGHYSFSTPYYPDLFLIKYDFGGNVIWKRSYGNERYEVLNTGVELDDGSIVLVGWTTSFNSNSEEQGLILKIDSEGQLLWSKLFRSSAFYSITKGKGGKFFLAMMTNTSVNHLLGKMNGSGEFEWVRSFPVEFFVSAGVGSKDGGLIATAIRSEEVSTDVYKIQSFVFKMSSDSAIQRGKEFYVSGSQLAIEALSPTNHDGYIVSAGSPVFKMDRNWNVIWSKQFRQRTLYAEIHPTAIVASKDGYFVASDVSVAFGYYGMNLTRLNEQGSGCRTTKKGASVFRRNAKIPTQTFQKLVGEDVRISEGNFSFQSHRLPLQSVNTCRQ